MEDPELRAQKLVPVGKKPFFKPMEESTKWRMCGLLLVVLAILVTTFVCVGYRLYVDPKTRNGALLRDSDALARDVDERLLLTSKTFAAQLAAEFYGATFETVSYVYPALMMYAFESQSKFKDDLEAWRKVFEEHPVMQSVLNIDYYKIEQKVAKNSRGDDSMEFRIPMRVRTWNADAEPAGTIDEFICGVRLLRAKPSARNPSGIRLLALGKVYKKTN